MSFKIYYFHKIFNRNDIFERILLKFGVYNVFYEDSLSMYFQLYIDHLIIFKILEVVFLQNINNSIFYISMLSVICARVFGRFQRFIMRRHATSNKGLEWLGVKE